VPVLEPDPPLGEEVTLPVPEPLGLYTDDPETEVPVLGLLTVVTVFPGRKTPVEGLL
jgi:hypothetical protein